MTRMRRAVHAGVAAVLLLSTLLAVAAPAAGTAKYPLNPAKNIPVPSYVFSGACRTAPTGQDCSALLIRALNDARHKMGEPSYALQARFRTLSGAERLLVLANADRVLYGRNPLTALNATLSASARQGAQHDADPAFVKVNGNQYVAGASNWAAGSPPMNNPLYAYYLWMYDDGPGSANLDCTAPGDPGCWGHRDGTLLAIPAADKMFMGVGTGVDSRGYYAWTELFEAFAPSDYIPVVPTVETLSTHVASAGETVHVTGFGLYHAGPVDVVGRSATVLNHHNTSIDIKVPAGAGSGYVVVHSSGGTSNQTYAAAFRYG